MSSNPSHPLHYVFGSLRRCLQLDFRWLDEKESIVAQHRLLEEVGNSSDQGSMKDGLVSMIKDFKVGTMMINHLLITICASFTK